jgi:acyl-coenzyme A synthetase/AMP-(fatty) acid ligase
VVLKHGSQTSSEALLRQLSAIIPRYAVPSHLLLAERFPQTGSGKTDRLQLACRYQERFATSGE